MSITEIDAKGRTTVPIEIRQAFGLQPGDRLTWRLKLNTTFLVSPMGREGILDCHTYRELYEFDPGVRAVAIREGFTRADFGRVAQDMRTDPDKLGQWVGLRKRGANAMEVPVKLPRRACERLLAIVCLLGKLHATAGKWDPIPGSTGPQLARWLALENLGLGGKCPWQLLATAEGRTRLIAENLPHAQP